MIDERIADRRRAVREQDRDRRLRRTMIVAGLLVLVGIVVVVERSALVGLEEVHVVGTERLSPDEVRDAAALPLGTSTLRLGLRDAVGRVEALALVRQASARRLDPLTVEITVDERQPVLVVSGRGVTRTVDRDGVVLFEGDLDGLPTVALSGSPPPVGATAGQEPALRNAVEVHRGLSGALRSRVVHYAAAAVDDLTLVLDDGTEVLLGRVDRLEEKIRALGAVLGDLGDVRVDRIDVRAPSTPVIVDGR